MVTMDTEVSVTALSSLVGVRVADVGRLDVALKDETYGGCIHEPLLLVEDVYSLAELEEPSFVVVWAVGVTTSKLVEGEEDVRRIEELSYVCGADFGA